MTDIRMRVEFDDTSPEALSDLLSDKDIEAAANTALALMKHRIVQKGKRADGEDIKPYDTERTVYIPLEGIGTGNPLMKPRGGELTRGIKGQPPRTMRFPSYAVARAKAGRSVKPNLMLSGNTLGKRFRVLAVRGLEATIGWPQGSEQGLVAVGLDDRDDGEIFSYSDAEVEAITEVLVARIYVKLQQNGVPITMDELRTMLKVRTYPQDSGD